MSGGVLWGTGNWHPPFSLGNGSGGSRQEQGCPRPTRTSSAELGALGMYGNQGRHRQEGPAFQVVWVSTM